MILKADIENQTHGKLTEFHINVKNIKLYF